MWNHSRTMSLRCFGWAAVSLICMLTLNAQSARADASALAAHELRLSQELNSELAQEASRALTWRVTWTAINGALAIASAIGFWTAPQAQRPSWIVGSIASSLSAVYSWALPLAVEADASSARRAASLAPQQRSRRLQELYANAAEDEAERVCWYWHVINLAMAVVPAVILWVGYERPQEGAITGLAGLLLGELSLLTQPTRLRNQPPALAAGLRASIMGQNITVSYTLAW